MSNSADDKNDERRTPRAWVWRQREGGSEFIMNLPPASPKEKEKYDGTALFFGDESAPAKLDIKALVNRFLAWPLPESVCSDMCATMQGYPSRVGTNLLTANEARQMLEYVLRDFIPSNATNSETVAAALDRMIKSVEKDIAEQDPGNHSTIGFYRGELKGLKAAWYMLTKSDATESGKQHG